jgi:MFS family permease
LSGSSRFFRKVIIVASNVISWFVRRGGLWAHADFMRLWGAQSISIFGTYITLIALPLLAATTLDASPLEMGVLTAAGSAPFLVIGLFVGVWVDRLRKRPLLIAADIGRSICLLAIPAAALLDRLSIPMLVVVAFVHGILAVLFDVADTTYLPSLVRRDQLVEANGRLELSASFAQITGPALSGAVISILTAPFAMLINSVSYLGSAFLLRRIRHVEPEPAPESHESVRKQIATGFRVIRDSRVLGALIGASTGTAFFGEIFMAIYILFLAQELGLSATEIGAIYAIGGVGALLGAALSGPVSQRIGAGNTIVLGQAMFGLTGMQVPLAVLVPSYALPLVIASEFLQWGFLILRQVNSASIRQAFTPLPALGRVQATSMLAIQGMKPIGALLGGVLATIIGAAWTLTIAEIGMLLAVTPLLLSPVHKVHSLDDEEAPDLPSSATMSPIDAEVAQPATMP